jgi:hypothetical protein
MGLQQIPSKGGIPSGNTASRPSNPVIGDTYYDGTLGFLMIYDGTNFVPCSAPAAQPSLVVTDAGSGMAYGTVKASVAFTEGITGGKAAGFTVTQGAQSVTSTSSPILVTITGNPGSYTFGGTAYNGFGTSPAAVTVSQSLTSVPDAPTIGTASPLSESLSLTFTAGATGGTAITNYQWSTDGTTYTALSPASTTSPVTIPGLTNGTSYTVRLKAVNANGVSAASGASNSATPAPVIAVDYLVVAGGGGGNRNPSNNASGGGGAGGYRTSIGGTAFALASGVAYDVVVGAGGAGSTTGTSIAGKGGNSQFYTIYSTGGGGGAYEGLAGADGGSGGGEASGSTNPGAGNEGGYTPVEGFAGGQASGDGGSGGGGAGAAGAIASSQSTNGAGGIGSNSGSAWATITSSGESGYYAGGGGGASYNASNNTGTGGLGGGGDGKSRAGNGEAGAENTGGGGGGKGGEGGGGNGGNGGSGIVILKYPSTTTATFSGGLTQTTYTDSGFKYSKITAGTGTVTF